MFGVCILCGVWCLYVFGVCDVWFVLCVCGVYFMCM